MTEETKPDLASLVAHIARGECRKLYAKRLTGLEEELAALYKTLGNGRIECSR